MSSQRTDPLGQVLRHGTTHYEVKDFCKGLKRSKLADDVIVTSVTRYKDHKGGLASHRSLALQMTRPAKSDFYIRLDRRPKHITAFEFTSNRGITVSQDTVRLETCYL